MRHCIASYLFWQVHVATWENLMLFRFLWAFLAEEKADLAFQTWLLEVPLLQQRRHAFHMGQHHEPSYGCEYSDAHLAFCV